VVVHKDTEKGYHPGRMGWRGGGAGERDIFSRLILRTAKRDDPITAVAAS